MAASSRDAVRRPSYDILRVQLPGTVAGLGSFEGVTSIGLGLRVKAGFRVSEVTTARHRFKLVTDVARR